MALFNLLTGTVKKLVLDTATSLLTTVASKEDEPALNPKVPTLITDVPPPLERVPCIYYPLCFRKSKGDMKAFIDSSSEINAMILAYTNKLGLCIRKTNVKA